MNWPERARMLTIVTGADGFVGRALTARMRTIGYPGAVRLVDRNAVTRDGYDGVAADLTDRADLARAAAGADRVIHLAAMPGGAAEADPAASLAINLRVTLDLLHILPPHVRLVHASSIAVFGAPLPAAVDDATPAAPASVYGTHKRMAELAVADAARRGAVDALSLRLPGLVARPRQATGFKSAFMSDVFSAMRDGAAYKLPVGLQATMWLMSAACCADALLNAVAMPSPDVPVLTLPALRVSMAALVAALADATGNDAAPILYAPDPAIEAAFGRLPPLATPAADRHGFRHDGDVATLVARGLAGLGEV